MKGRKLAGMKPNVAIVLVCIALRASFGMLATRAGAQAPSNAQAAPANLPAGVQDVVTLTKAGLGEDVILAKVKKAGVSYDLTTEQMIYLKNQGVSENVISGLLQAGPATTPPLAAAMVAATPSADPKQATNGAPWENSLGMKFVPVKDTGVLFCIWDTRVQDFAAFVKATDYDTTEGMYSTHADGQRARGNTWEAPGFKQGPTHPVCGVSWEDARAFCKWLTKKERAEGRLTAEQQYRMPTDAEWSVAVGLGPEKGDTPGQKSGEIKGVYPWGTQWPPPKGAGNYAGEEARGDLPAGWNVIEGYNDGYPRTSPVGSFRANQFGLYDMGGNLWQWCEDLYNPGEDGHVLRGASWGNADPGSLLSSFRGGDHPPWRYDDGHGFRCVLVVGASSSR